jgi:hypothetical protein
MGAAKKLTITIPDELGERLEQWRDRMNISRVCAEAIAEEIDRLESIWSNIEGAQAPGEAHLYLATEAVNLMCEVRDDTIVDRAYALARVGSIIDQLTAEGAQQIAIKMLKDMREKTADAIIRTGD